MTVFQMAGIVRPRMFTFCTHLDGVGHQGESRTGPGHRAPQPRPTDRPVHVATQMLVFGSELMVTVCLTTTLALSIYRIAGLVQ